MSAVPQSSVSQQPVPAGDQWIDLSTAASRSGRSLGHLSRLCRDEWLRAGKAERRSPDDGGKPVWWIRESADSSLSPIKSPEQLDADSAASIAALSDAQRALIETRFQFLRQWEKLLAIGLAAGRPKDQITESFLQHHLCGGKSIGRRTLYRWQTKYRLSGKIGLADARVKRPESNGLSGPETDDPFLLFVHDHFFTNRKLKLMHVVRAAEIAAIDNGWTQRGYKTCDRFVRGFPEQYWVLKRDGEDAFVAKCEPAIERDYSTLASNDIFCGDHHRFDVMILSPDSTPEKPKFTRPWVSAWQDVRSRKILGLRVFCHDPNADVILAAFKDAAERYGLPKKVMVDNGKDYDSRALQSVTKKQRRAGVELTAQQRLAGAFTILGIEVDHVWPYHGQSKPIERNFGTICDRFSRLWDTYCGNDTSSKPENLQQQLDAGKAPTLEEFTTAFINWLDADYHGTRHLGDAMDGQTPAQIYEKCLVQKRKLPVELLAFACMPRVGPVKVSKQGVTWKGLRYGAFDAKVQALYGQSVMLAVNNDDVSSLLICGLDGSLLCKARANTKLSFNADSQDVRDAIAEKKKLRKTMNEYRERRPRMVADLHDLVNRAATRKRQPAAPTNDPPPTILPVRTALDGQLDQVRKALASSSPARIAVGAESMTADIQPVSFSQLMASRMKPGGEDEFD
jgi:hypothetical protein